MYGYRQRAQICKFVISAINTSTTTWSTDPATNVLFTRPIPVYLLNFIQVRISSGGPDPFVSPSKQQSIAIVRVSRSRPPFDFRYISMPVELMQEPEEQLTGMCATIDLGRQFSFIPKLLCQVAIRNSSTAVADEDSELSLVHIKDATRSSVVLRPCVQLLRPFFAFTLNFTRRTAARERDARYRGSSTSYVRFLRLARVYINLKHCSGSGRWPYVGDITKEVARSKCTNAESDV